MTSGGDKIDNPGDARSPDVSMLDTKLQINSTFSMELKPWSHHL